MASPAPSKDAPAIDHVRQLVDDHTALQSRFETLQQEYDLCQQHGSRFEIELGAVRGELASAQARIAAFQAPISDDEQMRALHAYLQGHLDWIWQNAQWRIVAEALWREAFRYLNDRARTT